MGSWLEGVFDDAFRSTFRRITVSEARRVVAEFEQVSLLAGAFAVDELRRMGWVAGAPTFESTACLAACLSSTSVTLCLGANIVSLSVVLGQNSNCLDSLMNLGLLQRYEPLRGEVYVRVLCVLCSMLAGAP